MCTVTIVPQGKNNFILTSNRDEAPSRVSSSPQLYRFEDTQMLFPKDELSDGTWIGVSEKKRVICVLNGAFEFHERKPTYRLSRGVVAKHFLSACDIDETMATYKYDNIEPFTIIIADWEKTLKFYELVWDGTQQHIKQLPFKAHVWSSSTLYNSDMRMERQRWFDDFKAKHELHKEAILKFHKTAGKGNLDYGVIMDRGFIKTTSITQIEKLGDTVEIHYENLLKGLNTFNTFKLPEPING